MRMDDGCVSSTVAPSLLDAHTAHVYIHNTVELASIILSIIGGFYQHCWHSIIGQRLSIICQCLFQCHAPERKDLVIHGRFQCAMASWLPHRQSDWLRSHNFEVLPMCETTESVDHHGEVRYPLHPYSTHLINKYFPWVHFKCTQKATEYHECDTEIDLCWGWLGLACETTSVKLLAKQDRKGYAMTKDKWKVNVQIVIISKTPSFFFPKFVTGSSIKHETMYRSDSIINAGGKGAGDLLVMWEWDLGLQLIDGTYAPPLKND